MEARHLLIECFSASILSRALIVRNKNQEALNTLLPIEQDIIQYGINHNIQHVKFAYGIFNAPDENFHYLNSEQKAVYMNFSNKYHNNRIRFLTEFEDALYMNWVNTRLHWNTWSAKNQQK